MKRLLTAALALTLIGCEPAAAPPGAPKGTLTTGRVDTAMILQADPEYQKQAEAYYKEQLALKSKYFEMFKSARADQDENEKKKIAAAFNDADLKLTTKWNEKTTKFLNSRHDKLRTAAEQVAKDQKIDMVVVDSRQAPSVEYGAIDITQEVMLRMAGTDNKTPAPQEKK